MKFVWPSLKPRLKPPVVKPVVMPAPQHEPSRAVPSPASASDDSRVAALAQMLKGLVSNIRLNSNERTLLSLRGSKSEGIRLSLHRGLLDHPAALAELPAWIRGRGRVPGPALKAAIDTVFGAQAKKRRAHPSIAPSFTALNGPVDLESLYAEVHGQWFPKLTRPPIAWGPHQRPKRRRHIRFAAYHRRPHARIIVNRLLDQSWVAHEFLRYVLYHELCHHAQACDPVRGENPHSVRFKEWEACYPRFHELLAWEKVHLDRFLSIPESPGHVESESPAR